MAEDQIPIVETYHGVPIHDQQPRERIENVVQPEIDQVIGLTDVGQLLEFAKDISKTPEARLFAAAKIEALWEIAAEERRVRPVGITLECVKATVAGLDSSTWRSPTHYCSDLDVMAPAGAVKREGQRFCRV
jgi:hypothetical protein